MKSANPRILTINGGSSSIRFALFEQGDQLRNVLRGKIERIGLPGTMLLIQDASREGSITQAIQVADFKAAVGVVMDRLEQRIGIATLTAVGHRVVHGGTKYLEPHRITPEMISELRQLTQFDPEHMPAEIMLMEAFHLSFPELTQIACFDTAFHRNMPRVARLLPIPRRYEAQGVCRYGFHGLSYAYLMQELEHVAGAAAASGRVILAHLGNGASMAAVLGGRSMDTTMAFTPAAGLMMSTRCGDVDPGLVTFLARSEQMTAAQFDHMANRESGLLGVSETSSDMRDLLARETEDVRASEAVALFCYQAKKQIGAYAAVLGGFDTLVFTGGIGENAAAVRARICAGLGVFGIELDESRNAAHAGVISTDASRVTVRVIRTNEELMIATSVCHLLGLAPSTKEIDR